MGLITQGLLTYDFGNCVKFKMCTAKRLAKLGTAPTNHAEPAHVGFELAATFYRTATSPRSTFIRSAGRNLVPPNHKSTGLINMLSYGGALPSRTNTNNPTINPVKESDETNKVVKESILYSGCIRGAECCAGGRFKPDSL